MTKVIMEKLFTMSPTGKSEYCCNIVKVAEIKPVEGSDFLGYTNINGQSIVVRKDQVHEGDVLFYASNECQLNLKFLSVNNLFDIDSFNCNANATEVKGLLAKAENTMNPVEKNFYRNEAKKKVGFFSQNGRVRMIQLRKMPSYGFLFSKDEMAKFCPKVKDINIEDYINQDFDTVDGELFVKAFVPFVAEKKYANNNKKHRKHQKIVDRFDRMLPGEFKLHYDTQPLGKNIWRLNPDDNVTITVKEHGKSAIFSNVRTKIPIKLSPFKRIWNLFVDSTGLFKRTRIIDYVIGYGNVYSSRRAIKNQYINKKVTSGYYKTDIWGEHNELLKDHISQGMTVYGEIVGYDSGSDTMIQKQYDYGCERGTNKFMPYRITNELPDGKKYEWNVNEVKEWTERLIKDNAELKDKIEVIQILYHGRLKDLYPYIMLDEHWNKNVFEALKNDKEHFGMELDEPLCKNKVPREGIVLRIDNDEVAEAFKLKTDAFYRKEQKLIDKGEIDAELSEGNY